MIVIREAIEEKASKLLDCISGKHEFITRADPQGGEVMVCAKCGKMIPEKEQVVPGRHSCTQGRRRSMEPHKNCFRCLELRVWGDGNTIALTGRGKGAFEEECVTVGRDPPARFEF